MKENEFNNLFDISDPAAVLFGASEYEDDEPEIKPRTRGAVTHTKQFYRRFTSERALEAAIESSANINTNPRTEQTVITVDTGLARFYKDFFDGIKSFERNFDDWKPFNAVDK